MGPDTGTNYRVGRAAHSAVPLSGGGRPNPATRTVAPMDGRPVMLAIAGDSATGKTTLARGLVEALGASRSTAISVDNYHCHDRVERAARGLTPLHPAANYLGVMDQHLQLLALGQPILQPVYDHSTGTLGRPVLVTPRDYVIVEGFLPLHSKVARACFDVTVFVEFPEPVRRMLKIQRDVHGRGYTEQQVLAELERRKPEAEAFIRPQRAYADIVVRFAPIEERGEDASDPLSATVLLRPTIPHPDLMTIVSPEHQKAIHLKLLRDDDGKPVDALHIHAYAPAEVTRRVQEAIWAGLGRARPLPDCLGLLGPERPIRAGSPGPDNALERRSEPLAVVQLLLLYHLLRARS